jgi:hypothetical protein
VKTSSNRLRQAGLLALGLGAVATTLAFTFTLSTTGVPVKWPAGTIPLTIMLGDSPTLFDGSTFNTSARTAANSWNAVIGSAQIQSAFATGSPADDNDRNEVGFATTIFGRAFDSGVLAVTTGSRVGNERLEADIIFNTANYSWDSYRGSRPSSLPVGTVDLQRVAIHEIGHLLGLDHPDEAGQPVSAIMNSQISQNVDAQTLDDIDGARSIYGPPGVPANDAFANATTVFLSSTSTTVKGYNTNATKETGEPRHADNSGGRSVWWRWTAPSAGTVTLDTRGSYYDTTLGVYTGTSVSALTAIASNDDLKLPTPGDPSHVQASELTFVATSGTTYRFAVDGFNNGDEDPSDQNGADSAGITLNLAFTGTVGTPPTISTHPASVTVNSGASASFSVTATGSDPLSYQWLLNSVAISGSTSSTLSLSNVTSSNAGTYSVTVTNPAGSVSSNSATLTVNTPAPPAPAPSGGGGGGGAPSLWFCAVLAALGLARYLRRRQ